MRNTSTNISEGLTAPPSMAAQKGKTAGRGLNK
jgi:hypothetical protein